MWTFLHILPNYLCQDHYEIVKNDPNFLHDFLSMIFPFQFAHTFNVSIVQTQSASSFEPMVMHIHHTYPHIHPYVIFYLVVLASSWTKNIWRRVPLIFNKNLTMAFYQCHWIEFKLCCSEMGYAWKLCGIIFYEVICNVLRSFEFIYF
jgi:hypothetical protein